MSFTRVEGQLPAFGPVNQRASFTRRLSRRSPRAIRAASGDLLHAQATHSAVYTALRSRTPGSVIVMDARLIYRIGIWLPLIVPAAVVAIMNLLDLRPTNVVSRKIVQLLAVSLLYGGLPYAILAAWASWWITGRPESEIRRLMFRAPLMMAGMFALTAITVGIGVGRLVPFVATAILGAIVAVPLGYAYVGLVLWLRHAFGAVAAR